MKFSHTLIGIAAAFASASSESNSNMNMFSKLAESAVDASSWNFEEGKHVCRVYGDPHVLAFNDAKINFAGTGEFMFANFETTGLSQPIYVTASTFNELNATDGKYSYVDQVGFFCGDSKMVTRAPYEVGHTPAVFNYYNNEVTQDLPADFSAIRIGEGSNVVREDGDDVILQAVCSPQGLDVEVELFVKYHVNEFNNPVLNFAIRFAQSEDITSVNGMCQSPCQAADEFYGGAWLDNGYCDSTDPIEIRWGLDFQSNLCGPCSWGVINIDDLEYSGELFSINELASSGTIGVDITVPQVPSNGDVCYNPPQVGWPP